MYVFELVVSSFINMFVISVVYLGYVMNSIQWHSLTMLTSRVAAYRPTVTRCEMVNATVDDAAASSALHSYIHLYSP